MKFTVAAIVLSGLGLTAAVPVLSSSSTAGHRGRLMQFLHRGHAQHHGDVGQRLDGLAEVLDLSVEQRAAIAALLAETQAFADIKQLIAQHAAQVDVVHAGPFDEAQIREASAAVGTAQADVAVSLARLMHDVHAVLTDEQVALVKTFHPNLRARVGTHVAAFELSLATWIEANQ